MTTTALLEWGSPRGDNPTQLMRSRKDLPALTRLLGFTRGAELGVWRGGYSEMFCLQNPHLHMLSVDPWLSYDAWMDSKNTPTTTYKPVEAIEDAYQQACDRLRPLNCTIVRATSTDAARDVPDASLDFVYIDANHTYEAVTEDLETWAPKVRKGGIVSGHDFRVNTKKPLTRVVPAVRDFVARHGIAQWFVLAADRTPSFLWVRS